MRRLWGFLPIWSSDEKLKVIFGCFQTCSAFPQRWVVRADSVWAFWYSKHLVVCSESTDTAENVMASWLYLPKRTTAVLCFVGVTHLISLLPAWTKTLPSPFIILTTIPLPTVAALPGSAVIFGGSTLQVEQMLVYLLGGNVLNKS